MTGANPDRITQERSFEASLFAHLRAVKLLPGVDQRHVEPLPGPLVLERKARIIKRRVLAEMTRTF